MQHFDKGVELGRLIERQRRTEDSVLALTRDVKEVRAEVTDIRVTLQRWALVASLWGGALMVFMDNDKLADIAVKLIRDVAGKN